MRRDNVPSNDNDLLSFTSNISTRVSATPTAFGVTAPIATQLATYLGGFNTALTAAQNPETRGHSTIFAKNTAKATLVAYLRMVIRQIQGTSTVTDQQRTDLGITVRKTPSWPGNPGTPYKIKASLTTLGYIELSWKCTNPAAGTMYQLWRTIDAGVSTYIGGTANKKFLDSTVPAGSGTLTYQIQAVRSTGVGEWATLVVKLGVSPDGTSAIAGTSESPSEKAKIAA